MATAQWYSADEWKAFFIGCELVVVQSSCTAVTHNCLAERFNQIWKKVWGKDRDGDNCLVSRPNKCSNFNAQVLQHARMQ